MGTDLGRSEKASISRRRAALTSFVFGLDDIFRTTFTLDLGSLTPTIKVVAEAFSQNVIAAGDVAHIPYLLVHDSVLQRRFQSLVSAARIRRLPLPGDEPIDEDMSEREARHEAQRKLEAVANAEEGRSVLVEAIVAELARALESVAFTNSAKELLRQTAVMLWASLEVLAFDGLVALLNARPDLAVVMAAADHAKKNFQRGIPIDVLAQHGYDVSSTMGTVLMSGLRNEGGQIGLPMMKDLFSALCPDDEPLHAALGNANAWLLYQQRHLIVHRRAVVDRSYLTKTGAALELGSTLDLDRFDVEGYFRLSGEIGRALVLAMDRSMRSS
jgi:hypothetical protein